MNMDIDLKVITVLVVLCLSPAEGAQCYICDQVSHSEDCSHAGFCGAGQQCYTQRLIGDGLNDYFKVGCVDREVCSKSQFSLFGSFGSLGKKRSLVNITRRDNDPMVTCLQCCDGDLCNKALCGAVKTNRRRCFECPEVNHPKDCERIVECGRDEQCFTHYGPLHQNGRYAYEMKCMTARACNVLTSPQVALQTGCTRCCNHTDYCNFEVCNNWTTPVYASSKPAISTQPVTTSPAPPVIKGQTSAMYTKNIHLDCVPSGPVLSISWYHNQNDPLPPEVTSSGGVLDINNLNETRAGRYTCMTVGPQGNILTTSTLVTITDTVPIVVSVIKEPPVLSPGQLFTIKCSVIGFPKPKVSWQFVGSDGSSTIPSQVNFSNDQKTLVILHYASIHHDGRWTCTATNYLGRSQGSVIVP